MNISFNGSILRFKGSRHMFDIKVQKVSAQKNVDIKVWNFKVPVGASTPCFRFCVLHFFARSSAFGAVCLFASAGLRCSCWGLGICLGGCSELLCWYWLFVFLGGSWNGRMLLLGFHRWASSPTYSKGGLCLRFDKLSLGVSYGGVPKTISKLSPAVGRVEQGIKYQGINAQQQASIKISSQSSLATSSSSGQFQGSDPRFHAREPSSLVRVKALQLWTAHLWVMSYVERVQNED